MHQLPAIRLRLLSAPRFESSPLAAQRSRRARSRARGEVPDAHAAAKRQTSASARSLLQVWFLLTCVNLQYYGCGRNEQSTTQIMMICMVIIQDGRALRATQRTHSRPPPGRGPRAPLSAASGSLLLLLLLLLVLFVLLVL